MTRSAALRDGLPRARAAPVWKRLLLAEDVRPAGAAAVGDLVDRLHAEGAHDQAVADRFATDDNFHVLRFDP